MNQAKVRFILKIYEHCTGSLTNQQLQEVKRKKTEIVKKSNNPAFQESFNFKADESDIETFGVRVTAMQHMTFPEKGKLRFNSDILLLFSRDIQEFGKQFRA